MSSAVETTSPRSAEAGHWGKEVRSDVHVAFEARDSGGVEISLESRVAPYYGAAILEQTREVLGELGVKHARVAIHDEGALPFVIAARIEAAARRAGIALGKRSLPEQHPLPAPSHKDRLRRSRLYLPGSEPKYYINASLHAAGCGDSRSGRFGASRRKRCRAHPGAKHAAGGRFRIVRAHGAHQPVAAGARRSGGSGGRESGPDSDSEGRASPSR